MGKKKKKFVPESRCLNCDTLLTDQFCSHCGQKAGLDKDHFWHLVWHFISEYFHFDGKFLNTAKAILTRPGKVTREYLDGKRKTYLHPIQMYLFVSALFFIGLNSSLHSDRHKEKNEKTFEER